MGKLIFLEEGSNAGIILLDSAGKKDELFSQYSPVGNVVGKDS